MQKQGIQQRKSMLSFHEVLIFIQKKLMNFEEKLSIPKLHLKANEIFS